MNREIMNMFKSGNVCVTGERGSGKDMLMSNVCVRIGKPYVSNINYDGKHQFFKPLHLTDYDLKADCVSFIEGTLPKYTFPHADGTNIWISDCSVYFPNYQTLLLNKKYEGFVNFMALSRQLGECNVHVNAQNIGRIWEKIPEQCFRYIQTLGCICFGKLVIQRVRTYDMRESCERRIPPMPKPRYGLSRKSNFERQAYELQRLSYQAKYGTINEYTLIYINRSHYDTRRFKTILAGEINEKV